MNSEEISVLVAEPGKRSREARIKNTISTFQEIVGGPVEIFRPWTDDITIICNENGKMQDLQPNRAIGTKRGRCECTFDDLCSLLTLYGFTNPLKQITGYVTLSEDSFPYKRKEYERTYAVSSAAIRKVVAEDYAIFGNSIDGTDRCAPLHIYMNDEKIGWKAEKCFFMRRGEVIDIISGTFIVCGMNWDTGEFRRLTEREITECMAIFNDTGINANDPQKWTNV